MDGGGGSRRTSVGKPGESANPQRDRRLKQPWLGALRVFGTVVVVVSVVAGPAIFIYAAKRPSEPMERVAILSDTVITANRSKLETQPIAWVGIAAIFLGVGTGATREWTRREDARTSATVSSNPRPVACWTDSAAAAPTAISRV
jgi:hypothetical protein